jgi:uncharacterized membrane protein
MTKNEYLEQLELELKKRNVPDVAEILSEYEQHFAFKLSDGFTETDIASRLENPIEIAAQFSGETETVDAKPKSTHAHKKNRGLIVTGLGFAALLLATVVVPLYLWTVSLAIGAVGLVGGGGAIGAGVLPGGWVPTMPLAAQLIFGLALIALGVLLFIGALVFLKLTTQLCRAFARFSKNSLSDGTLPPRPLIPQFSHKSRRQLRTIALVAMSVFGICFIAGFAFLVAYTKSFQFWHVLEWFT